MSIAKMSEQEYAKYLKTTGTQDPVIEQKKQTTKQQKDLEILLAVGLVQDKQCLEYWKTYLQAQDKKNKNRKTCLYARKCKFQYQVI